MIVRSRVCVCVCVCDVSLQHGGKGLLDYRDKNDQTVLHYAAYTGNVAVRYRCYCYYYAWGGGRRTFSRYLGLRRVCIPSISSYVGGRNLPPRCRVARTVAAN